MRMKPFNLSIPSPCTQAWDKMQPVANGAYCKSCKKVVHDYSQMSDEEIIKYLLQNDSKNACGKFRMDQLERNIIPINNKIPTFHTTKILLLGLLTLKFFSPANAQTGHKELIHFIEQKNYGGKVISGSLKDVDSGMPLVNIQVILVGTSLQTFSNQLGNFNLSIPDSLEAQSFTLKLVSTQYWRADTVLEQNSLPITINLTMTKLLNVVQIDGHDNENSDKPIYSVGALIRTQYGTINSKYRRFHFWYRIKSFFKRRKLNSQSEMDQTE